MGHGKKSLIYGVGVNDADYPIRRKINGKNLKPCPFYLKWYNMLDRCYSEYALSIKPTYIDCEVCEEWLLFSNFKAWMENQDWQGNQLDKDILIPNNRIYSPETCMFIPRSINMFVVDSKGSRGDCMIGVCYRKSTGKYESSISNPLTKRKEFLGVFTNELEAHLAWKTRKHELACLLADSELVSDPRLAEALRTRYI